ncbi:MAG: Sulphatase-modifying factor protein [Proteobacteria bacterium]|nr:MAG: Sulphatase-modifying factor protein [Pseudomonadota bacterium]
MEAIQYTPDTELLYVDELSSEQRISLQANYAQQLGVKTFFNDTLRDGREAPRLAVIPAGRFEMGSDTREFGHRREEHPQHLVSVYTPFAIGIYPIMAEEFELFCEATEWHRRPELLWNTGRYPVINIRMQDVKLYLKWLSEQTGQNYRLPTEAEWEYAARAGSRTPFHFGESISCKEVLFNPAFPYQEAMEKKRWYLPRCVPSSQAGEVGMYAANAWGLYDVHGNVWEFTSNHWTSSHLGANRDGSGSTSADPYWYVTKGGSWFDPAVMARSAARKKRYLDEIDVNLGFRIVRELKLSEALSPQR